MYIRWSFVVLLGGRLTSAVQLANPRAPLTTTGPLIPRQEYSCPAGDIYCTVGGGCCPSNAPCTFVMGQPKCDEPCFGPDCGNGICCQLGYACPTDGGSFCIDNGFFPGPTFLPGSSSNPDGPVATPAPTSVTPEPSSEGSGSIASSDQAHRPTGVAPTESTAASSSSIGVAPTESFPASSSSISVPPTSSFPTSSSSVGAAVPTRHHEAASLVSPGKDSWIALLLVWVMGLPFIA